MLPASHEDRELKVFVSRASSNEYAGIHLGKAPSSLAEVGNLTGGMMTI